MGSHLPVSFGHITVTHDLTELPFRLDPSFDAITFIALYRIAERHVSRAPTEGRWLNRLALLQATLDEARSPEVFATFRDDAKQAIAIFASVLRMEGMSALNVHPIFCQRRSIMI
ncbi:hypothetical protein NMY22_g15770 [Coprinellus aureogranulatus]|nr:hypothetical protein NMY22_g15770 [Coprinellus aureogranulatus]